MLFASALASAFSQASRARGHLYARGRIKVIAGSDTSVTAEARGTRVYDVAITRRDDGDRVRFEASCTCPLADRNLEPCKHMFATLLVADQRRHLAPGRRITPGTAYLALIKPAGSETAEDTFEAEDETQEFSEGRQRGAGWRLTPKTRNALREAWARRRLTARVTNPGFSESDTFSVADSVRHMGPEARRAVPRPEMEDRSRRFLTPTRADLFIQDLNGRLLAAAGAPPTFRYAAGELLYVVDAPVSRTRRMLVVELMWRKRLKQGGWGRPMAAAITPEDVPSADDDDRRILGPLIGGTRAGASGWFDDSGASTATAAFEFPDGLISALLPAITHTGRAYLRQDEDPQEDLRPLAWDDGPPWEFRPTVAASSRGFVPGGTFHRADATLDLLEPALVLAAGFVITSTHVARLLVPPDLSLLMALRTAGRVEVPERLAADLGLVLARAGMSAAQLPEILRVTELDVAPVPCLSIVAPDHDRTMRFNAELLFDYDGSRVPADRQPTAFDAGQHRLIRRRPTDEGGFLDRLPALGLREVPHYGGRRRTFDLPPKRMLAAIHTLLSEGWIVDGRGRPYRNPGAVQFSVTSGVDWFDLEATVAFGDMPVRMTEVFAALKRGEVVVALGDGSVGLLPEDWMRRFAPLAAAGEAREGRFRFARPQAALLDALLASQAPGTTVAVDARFDQMRRDLASFTTIAPAEPPSTLRGTLRDYQREGLGWLQFLRRFGFGGCLADDMGLGKTIMVLALLAWWREERERTGGTARPSLVIVPRSLVHNWKSEAAMFTPHLVVLDYSNTARAGQTTALADADIVLATYGTLRQDALRLKDVEFEYVILDEAQTVKNANTLSAKSARLLHGRHRLALSGTPIENHLGELWSLFEFLNPGLLGRSSVFQRSTSLAPDGDTAALLSRALRPFILRRTKLEVARELPARTEQTILCDLSRPEREFYDGLRRHYRDALLARVDRVGLAKSKIQILEALLRLRQAACHVGLVDRTRPVATSAKFDVLLPKLREVVEEGHKALVFSQFTSLLALLRTQLDAAGLRYEYLDGRTRDRHARVAHFQEDPGCPLFLISLKAGGLGLNLTAAEYVFLLDPWWNPAVEAQAVDRAHRIGQTREVFAYRLIARDTVEEKVLALQHSKRALAEAVLSASAGGLRHLQREDLELLLS